MHGLHRPQSALHVGEQHVEERSELADALDVISEKLGITTIACIDIIPGGTRLWLQLPLFEGGMELRRRLRLRLGRLQDEFRDRDQRHED